MENRVVNLWPENIGSALEDLSPVAILRQQASILGEKTKNLVEGQVETRTADYQRFLQHTFSLIAPALDFYRYPLFGVEHQATDWYPLTIKLFSTKPEAPDEEIKVVSQEQFEEELRKIFGSEETVKVIQSLIAQSQG